MLRTTTHEYASHHRRWQIPADTPEGEYRLVHYGDAKTLPWATPQPFQGSSSSFTVTRNASLLRRLLAAAAPSGDPNAAAELQRDALCQFVDSTLSQRLHEDVVAGAGNSSWARVPEFQRLQRLQQAAVLQRLGCSAQ